MADAALDFFGGNFPNVLPKIVNSGQASGGVRGVGRFTAFGAELNPTAEIEGVAGTATVETMFESVEKCANCRTRTRQWTPPFTFSVIRPGREQAIQDAKDNAKSDRAIKRVLAYGADDQTLEVLRAAKKRGIHQVVVVVGNYAQSYKLRALIADPNVPNTVSSDYAEPKIVASRTFKQDKRWDQLFNPYVKERPLAKKIEAELGGPPDVIVERPPIPRQHWNFPRTYKP